MPPSKKTREVARPSARRGELSFVLDPKADGPEPIYGAAYMMTDKAYVSLETRPGGRIEVRLRPKAGEDLEALRPRFEDECRAQKARWALAKANQPIREYLVENAVRLAVAPPPAHKPEPPEEEPLTDAQKDEIERLIAEVEEEIKTMKAAPAASDPKGIKATWEERQQTRAKERA